MKLTSFYPKALTLLCFYLIFLSSCKNDMDPKLFPVDLTCEYLDDPTVIDILNPRLSWINLGDQDSRGLVQSAYRIQVATSPELLLQDRADVWDSNKVNSNASYLVQYKGKPLRSTTTYWWRVKVWDGQDSASEWSDTASWGMGLLDSKEWSAQWIGAPWQDEEPLPDPVEPRASLSNDQLDAKTALPPPAPLMRKEFTVKKELESAKVFLTGLGFFEFYLNGEKVGNDVLVPNHTDYGNRPGLETDRVPIENNFKEQRVMYLAYDIKSRLIPGKNAMGAILGNGFYNAPKTWTASYGTPRFIAQLYLNYTDGTQEIIGTDNDWKVARGPIVSDLVYEGEHYDARLEQKGWSTPEFDDESWQNVVLRQPPGGRMKAHMSEPDRVMERIKPKKVDKIDDGHYLVDFGEEITGWLKISDINGVEGQRIAMRYLSNDGISETTGSNSYISNGKGLESYAARFTWFVFRYVELTNWPGELDPSQLTAEAVYTHIKTTGKFETSNQLLNDINQIWWRSQTDNMHGGLASDCPNRERSGYTGDGQVACVTVMHNFDAKAFYNKWIQDIVGSQNPDTGYVPNGAPWQPGCGGGPAWGAAVNIMPWEFYLHYGDLAMLSNTYDSMKQYVGYMLQWTNEKGVMHSQRAGHTEDPFRWVNLGEWAQPFELPPDPLVHTFYLWRCVDITAKTAKTLGLHDESIEFENLANRTKQAFYDEFYDDQVGSYGPYGGNVFALTMGVPEEQESLVIEALRSDIAKRDGHLDTGIFGTRFFFEVLADYGMQDLAYEAMSKTTQPSFGWWVKNGNTTSWEGWNRPGSGNHPMFGGGLVWLYRKLAGMNADIAQPGYKNIIFKPQPVPDLDYVSYHNLTPYGLAGIRWDNTQESFHMKIEVPVGSTATVYIPFSKGNKVFENNVPIEEEDDNISFLSLEKNYAVYTVKSGTYEFSLTKTLKL